MAGHAPYIMPDGRSLAAVLRAEGTTSSSKPNAKKKAQRPKDELWGQLQHNKRTTASEQELAEIRAVERVGHRRRRQWLNDKLLRDLAGPMSTQDMESQFKPVPFGIPQPPSAFTLAAAPEHAALWDHFRIIDSDKEARVLQAWEAHTRQQQQQQHHVSSTLDTGRIGHVVLHQQQQQAAATAVALAKWARVERSARAALKKASVHSVLALEMQALQLIEQEDSAAELLLDLPDGFARLLMHGLAQFHGLQSSTCIREGHKHVLLQCRQRSSTTTPAAAPGAIQAQHAAAMPQQQQQPEQQQESMSPVVDSRLTGEGEVAAGGDGGRGCESEAVGAGSAGAEAGAAADWLAHAVDITCTDIIMALQELGGSLNHHTLGHYMKTVHGSTTSDAVCA